MPNHTGARTARRPIARIFAGALVCVVILAIAFAVLLPGSRNTLPVTDLGYPDSAWATVDHTRIHYRTRGTEKPVLLMLHGFGASTFSWRHVLEDETRTATRIAYDRPGFGLTERPADPTPYSPGQAVPQLVALMDHTGTAEAVLIAHSAGARIAMELAIEEPEKVAALVLLAPALGRAPTDPGFLCTLARIPGAGRIGPFLMRFTPPLLERGLRASWSEPDALPPEVRTGYRRPLTARHWDRGLWNVMVAAGCSQHRPPTPTHVPPDIPVLVITGDRDTIVSPAASADLASAMGARLQVIPHTGHLPHEEDPIEFARILDDFLWTHGLLGE